MKNVEKIDEKRIKLLNNNNVFYYIFTLYITSIYIFSFRPDYNIVSNMIFLLIFFHALGKQIKEKKIYIDYFYLIFLLFIVYSYITIFWTPTFNASVVMSNTLTLLFILSFSVYQGFINQLDGVKKILKSLYFAGMIMSIYTIFSYSPSVFIESIFSGNRLGSEISQANILGMYAAYTSVLSVYLGLEKKSISITCGAIIPILVILASGSRTGLLICLLGIILFLLLKNGIEKIYKGIFFSIVLTFILFSMLNFPILKPITSRFENLLNLFGNDSYVDSSTSIRLFMINYGLELFQNKPILGYGADSSQYLLSLVSNFNSYLHNNYVELLVNYGFLGFSIYYFMYIYVFIKAFPQLKIKNSQLAVIVTLMLMTLMADFGTVSYYRKMTFILLTLGILSTKIINKNTDNKMR